MIRFLYNLKLAVAAVGIAILSSGASAQDDLSTLMTELQSAEPEAAQRIAREIELRWKRSGSASADFLLKRGEDAIERGELDAAVEHLTALTDHAPEFTEGWVTRAAAFARQQKFGMALSDLEHALALNPQHYEAIYGLGSIFEAIGRPEDAYEAFVILSTIHPHYPDLSQTLERLEPMAKGQKL